jgi:hypothetical protein
VREALHRTLIPQYNPVHEKNLDAPADDRPVAGWLHFHDASPDATETVTVVTTDRRLQGAGRMDVCK